MRTDTADKIIQFVKDNGQVTAKQLYDYLAISPQAVFKQLKKLVENKKLVKRGKPPKVFYYLYQENQSIEQYQFSVDNVDILNEYFYTVTPAGKEKFGMDGFVYWCQKRGLNIESSVKDYVSLQKKYEQYRENGLIDGLSKLRLTFKEVFFDALFYQDFYAIERFGKTQLGQVLLYAKQSQDKPQMSKLIKVIKPSVDYLIDKYEIDGVGFIPPTVKRQVQLMTEVEKGLALSLPRVTITKIKTAVSIPQKTLNKLEDRIENAAHTIVVEDTRIFNNVLLIDDAIGSGATMNETARHLANKKLVRGKIIGLAITGSLKGFDVISEI